MKDFTSWAQDIECCEWVMVMIDMKDFRLWAQGSKSNEQLKVMDDMNELGYSQFRPLNAMNHLGLWMTLTTLGRELSALDTMNS